MHIWTGDHRPLTRTHDHYPSMQESKYAEFWYEGLRPYVHYIPLSRNLDDLVLQIRWAQANPRVAWRIAMAGRAWVRKVSVISSHKLGGEGCHSSSIGCGF